MVMPMVEIKEEEKSDVEIVSTDDETSEKQQTEEKKKSEIVQDTNDNQVKSNTTIESVYEDASDKLPSVSRILCY